MRLIKMKKTLFTLVLLAVGLLQVAAGHRNEASHFRAGSYKLVKGTVELCGQAQMQFTQGGQKLALSAYHVFTTTNKRDSFPEGNCKYDVVDQVSHTRNYSIYTYDETFSCNEGVDLDYNLKKQATITRNRILLNFNQTGEGAANYTCEWVRK